MSAPTKSQKMTYRIEKYAADGCTGPEDSYVIARGVGSLHEARDIVRSALGVSRLTSARRWAGMGNTVEAYHDYPASHQRADGCGGVAIVAE